MKKNKKRTTKELEVISKKIIEYYFNNPHANSYNDIQAKLNVDKGRIKKVLEIELERRFRDKSN